MKAAWPPTTTAAIPPARGAGRPRNEDRDNENLSQANTHCLRDEAELGCEGGPGWVRDPDTHGDRQAQTEPATSPQLLSVSSRDERRSAVGLSVVGRLSLVALMPLREEAHWEIRGVPLREVSAG